MPVFIKKSGGINEYQIGDCIGCGQNIYDI